jgi:N utilization substance protein B
MPSHDEQREARRLTLGALFEADFGQHTATSVLERRLADEGVTDATADLARAIVVAAVAQRDVIDAQIEAAAPRYPVVALARIDRALLRSAMAELLHCRATPVRVAIAEWVELARTYSGEPARRLMNGVLGRVAREAAERGRDMSASGNGSEGGGDRHTGGSTG